MGSYFCSLQVLLSSLILLTVYNINLSLYIQKQQRSTNCYTNINCDSYKTWIMCTFWKTSVSQSFANTVAWHVDQMLVHIYVDEHWVAMLFKLVDHQSTLVPHSADTSIVTINSQCHIGWLSLVCVYHCSWWNGSRLLSCLPHPQAIWKKINRTETGYTLNWHHFKHMSLSNTTWGFEQALSRSTWSSFRPQVMSNRSRFVI